MERKNLLSITKLLDGTTPLTQEVKKMTNFVNKLVFFEEDY